MIVLLMVLFSLLLLVKSADMFVDQTSALAKKLKMNDFLIGFTVVAFGTSLPELVSVVFSSISGHNQLIMSSIIGSNMANSCLIFGIIALFSNYRIHKRDVHVNIPLNLAAIVAFWALSVFMGFTLNWASGISLILIFVILQVLSKDFNHSKPVVRKYVKFNLLILVFSLILLIVSGKFCIDQIIVLASQFKISETILGYFLLALGTSLPELVTAWIALKKNDGELGVGSILGSNLFNLLFVLGISTFIRPLQLINFTTDLVFLSLSTVAVYVFAVLGKKYSFSKKEGLGLVTIYALFVLFQVYGR